MSASLRLLREEMCEYYRFQIVYSIEQSSGRVADSLSSGQEVHVFNAKFYSC